MNKQALHWFRPGAMAREGAVRRQKMRTSPRVELLEGRIVMSTFRVNTTFDTVAADLRTGKDATGHISLRSAIEAANMRGGNNTIILPAGTFTLTIAGANEDNGATGDLDISSNVTIKGKKAAASIVDSNGIDRVFQVIRGKVKISNVTIEHGIATEGGGLLNSGGQVTLSSVIVANNEASGAAGIAGKQGKSAIPDGDNGGDGTAGGNASGGGISNEGGSLTISKSTILANIAQGGNGGRGGDAGQGNGTNGAAGVAGGSGVGGNGGNGGPAGGAEGGGIFNASGVSLMISESTFASNRASGGLGGAGGQSAFGVGGTGGAGGNGLAGRPGGAGFGGSGGRAHRVEGPREEDSSTSVLSRSRDARPRSP